MHCKVLSTELILCQNNCTWPDPPKTRMSESLHCNKASPPSGKGWSNNSQQSANRSQLRSEQRLHQWWWWSCNVLISVEPGPGRTNRSTDVQRQQARRVSNRVDFRCIQHTRRHPTGHLADLPWDSRCRERWRGNAKHYHWELSHQ